jgi:hypothetical protein
MAVSRPACGFTNNDARILKAAPLHVAYSLIINKEKDNDDQRHDQK